jgi:hypothetical protein
MHQVEVYRRFEGGTSVNFYQTTRFNIPEYFPRHNRRRENLKSHKIELYFCACVQ